MRTAFPCQCCRSELEPARILAYLVESETRDNPTMLAAIRTLPQVDGAPLLVCRSCESRLRTARQQSAPKRGTHLLLAGSFALMLGIAFASFRD
jgi:hypothetical protein